jgi:hypothetical protein
MLNPSPPEKFLPLCRISNDGTIVIGSGGRKSCELCHLNSPRGLAINQGYSTLAATRPHRIFTIPDLRAAADRGPIRPTGARSRGSASAMGARGSRSSAGTLWPFRSAAIRARPSRASPPRHRPGYRSAAHHGENRLRREGQPDGRPERAGVSAGRVPVGFAGTGLDQGFVLACWLRNAASPASDTSTHVLSGAAPAT